MKKIYYIAYILITLCVSGCFEDDSTLGTADVPEIRIAEMRDTTIISYSGHFLKVEPNVESGYPEDKLDYTWYYYPLGNVNNEEWQDGFRRNIIGKERNLSYEINLPSGNYAIVLEVKSTDNQYASIEEFTLSVTTEFSSVYYVLKETGDGNSEIDLVSDTQLNPDMVTKIHGSPIPGKPLGLSYIYNQGYMTETGSMGAKAIYVFTDQDTRVYNTEDFAEIITRNSLSYQALPQSETPCNVFCAFVLMMLTDKGFYYTQPYDETMGYTSASRFGASTGAGGSPWVIPVGGGMVGYVYWSQEKHHLYYTDYNGASPAPMDYTPPTDLDETTLTCIAGGQNYVGNTETNWFLVENSIGERWLYTFGSSIGKATIERVSPSSHLASARIITANALSAPGLYAVDDNTLYLCYFEDDGNGIYDGINESPVKLPGIGSNETITYVSNQFLNGEGAMVDNTYDYDRLYIATQQGENYHLYLYGGTSADLPGGVPQQTVTPIEGKGIIKSIRYAAPLSLGIFDYIMGTSAIFPLCN